MTSPIEQKRTLLSFTIATLLLVGIGALSHWHAREIQLITTSRASARQIKFQIEALISLMKDAETGQRGFLLTRQDSYLEPYQEAIKELPLQMSKLEGDLKDEPEQLGRLKKIEGLVRLKLDLIALTIREQRARGPHSAIKIVLTNQGKTYMDEVRQIINEMKAVQDERIATRSQQAHSVLSRNRSLILFGSIFSVLLVLGACVISIRHQRKRSRVEEEIREANRLLEFQTSQLNQIIKVQHAITAGESSSKKMSKLIAEQTRELTESDGALIELVVEDEVIYYAASGPMESNIGFRMKIQGSLSGTCLHGRKMLVSEDTELDERVNREACRKLGVRSMIVVPLWNGDDAIGVLKTHSSRPHHFSKAHERALEIIGGVLSSSWSKAIAFEEKQGMIHALEAAQIQLKEATHAKSRFLANMSHEIRTPMNGVISMAELLSKSPLSEEQKDMVETIHHSADSLLSLINDILDISKIEAGKLRFEVKSFDVKKCVNGIVSLLGESASKKGLILSASWDPAVPSAIVGDEGRLRQILINLLGNAIKFTETGSVSLSVSCVEQTRSEAQLEFTVSDTGIGIPAEVIPHLFQPFSQGDASTQKKYGGTGLGLAISNELIRRMGGEISIRSELGKGSTFSFTACFDKNESSSARESTVRAEEKIAFPENVRILIAEDNLINQKIALMQLKDMGLRAEAVSNGKEALEAHRRAPFDLILMDCQMPEMDGYRATREIRALEGEGSRVPIIAMTANALDEDRKKCLDVGMNDYLSKPVKMENLKLTLQNWLVRREAA